MPYGLSTALEFQCLINDVLRGIDDYTFPQHIIDIYSPYTEIYYPCLPGPPVPPTKSTIQEGGELRVAPMHHIIFGLHPWPQWSVHGPVEARYCSGLAYASNDQRSTVLSGLFQLLLMPHSGLQTIAHPLMSLLHGGPKQLVWNPAAVQALTQLKTAFTSAQFLKQPDPSKPFRLEVDASEAGVGTILSEWFRDKPKFHRVAFFSQKMSSAEWNYIVGK